jgi:hypothetical protein
MHRLWYKENQMLQIDTSSKSFWNDYKQNPIKSIEK